ncbi:MAG: tRNA (adenosine(37)-N6)-threonylcarbamoyltransferase complex transferase subunit TsaD [Parcubacteria group bacterium]|nr:tRNA (adenosine(37)-N6)-threonylcarbamoyltransferase complex transferase subunit TsaD [Parcubacteria group bacterium]|tara:strand:- start:1444 stop:2460 length:1017 start_codon:yes stop_codon:yes gene_type:complete
MIKKNSAIILGIESSCDETAAALIEKKGSRFSILANTVLSQVKIHRQFGGVVPEVAARNHLENILSVVNKTLIEAKIKPKQIDKIAVTHGPGLITSLIVGAETAKNLAFAWQKPLIPINHLKAHLYANWLKNKTIKFPAIALIVSGGHTEIVLMKSNINFKKIGETVDDAAGEAFDKVAALLNLGYPGGPVVSKLADKGNAQAFKFPRPMMYKDNFNFSFSGLKTAVLYEIKKIPRINSKIKSDMCASFQQAAIDVLAFKTIKAAKRYKAKTIILSGGVAANKLLRKTLEQQATNNQLDFMVPEINLCTDNAAMIAAAGFFEKSIPWQKLRVNPNLEI